MYSRVGNERSDCGLRAYVVHLMGFDINLFRSPLQRVRNCEELAQLEREQFVAPSRFHKSTLKKSVGEPRNVLHAICSTAALRPAAVWVSTKM